MITFKKNNPEMTRHDGVAILLGTKGLRPGDLVDTLHVLLSMPPEQL